MDNWYLIAGLGNPGAEYAQTRHNAGFIVADEIARRRRTDWKLEAKFQAKVARTQFGGQRLILIEPQTFMNASGLAVQTVAAYYKIPPERLLVVVDDADLALGEIRMRAEGSSGGHHGLESIEQHLGTRAFARQRVGIGRRTDGVREITGYVLGRFEHADMPMLKAIVDRAVQQLESWLTSGPAKAMNDFNGMIKPPLVKES